MAAMGPYPQGGDDFHPPACSVPCGLNPEAVETMMARLVSSFCASQDEAIIG